MRRTPDAMARPGAIVLSRVSDRLTFLYVDKCRIERDDNGVYASINASRPDVLPADVVKKTTYLPLASLTAVLLGPGTTITQQAAAVAARDGCGMVFVGSGAVRSYSAFLSPYAPTTLLESQAAIWGDSERRTAAARQMLLLRFPDQGDVTASSTLDQLRGLEGARMKAVYRQHANRYRLTGWRRNTGALGEMDSVNIALNYANTALYGLTNAVIQALGLAPGLGFLHTGNRQAFVLDVADIYKTTTTIPAAFAVHASKDPGQEVMRTLRERFRLIKVLPRMVDDLFDVLGHKAADSGSEDAWEVNTLSLWSESGLVRAGVNHGHDFNIDGWVQ